MKYLHARYSILLILLLSLKAIGQNMVPNGNFENVNTCPNDYSQMTYSTGWRSFHSGTSDFFHSCSTNPLVSSPLNVFGYQQPASGSGYCGIYTYLYSTGYKEYVACTITPLSLGITYQVSMSVNLANSSGYTTRDLGAWFYDNGPTGSLTGSSSVLIVSPQISYSSYGAVSDTANWTRLVSTFVADSAYDNMVIGGFGNAITTAQVATGFGVSPIDGAAYYYIDSVVVQELKGITYTLPDTAFCAGDTLMLPFRAANTGYYTSANVFFLQVSDASGSFLGSQIVDSVLGGTGGVLKWAIPASVTNGTGYRLRIIATDSADTSLISRRILIGTLKPDKPVAGAGSTVCELSTLSLTASSSTPGVNYTWNGPDNFAATTANAARPNIRAWQGGRYIVSAWLYGCRSKDTTNITVTPTVGIITNTATTPVCQNDTLKLYGNSSAGVATTFSWSGPNGFISFSRDAMILNAPLAATGNYILTGNFSGCSSKDTVAVLVKPVPASVSMFVSSPVCQGGSLTLTGSTVTTGVSYNWTGPNGFSSSLQSPVINNLQTSASGSYIFTATLNGCSAKTGSTVIVIPNKVVVSSNAPVCEGDTLKLMAAVTGSASAYLWTGPNGFSSTFREPFILKVPANGSGNYAITVYINGGCQSRDTVAVVVKPQVAHATSSNSPVCAGDSLRLFATTSATGVSFNWAGPSFTTTVQNPVIYNTTTAMSGKYVASYTGTNGCTASDTLAVVVNASLLSITASANTPVCQSDTLKLAATNNVTGTIWAWVGPGSFTSSVQNARILNTPVLAAGRYYVKAALANGCFKRDSVDVAVTPGAAGVVATSNNPLCQGDTLRLTGTSTSSGVTYSWTGPNGFSRATQNADVNGVQLVNAGDYILNVILNGCSIRDTENVAITPTPPTPSPVANTPVCEGQTLNFSSGGTSIYTYIWTATTGFTSSLQNPSLPNVDATAAGTYSVRAMNGKCASLAATVNITVIPAPEAIIASVPGDSICNGAGITFNGSAIDAGASPIYRWYYNNKLISGASAATYNTAAANDNDTFFCTVTSNATCAAPYTDTSNIIHLRVFPWLAPAVNLNATPGGTTIGGDPITFAAMPVNGGDVPAYKWKLNNSYIPGVTNDTFVVNSLSDQDVICVEMTSNYLCPQPATVTSNCITVSINTTGINDNLLMSGVRIYPNPVTDELTIDGIIEGTRIQLFDVLGKLIHSRVSVREKEILNTSSLAKGAYLLQLTGSDGNRMNTSIQKQ